MEKDYIKSVGKQFRYYKLLGDQTLAQLPDDKLFQQLQDECNSIAVIIKHLHGNMLSRWTDFLSTDGEKAWRRRDQEFEEELLDRAALLKRWEEGWNCLFAALESLQPRDLLKVIYIRNEGQTVMDAINRQLAHYSYHVGQIVYIGKALAGKDWKTLSIPKNQSEQYNARKFGKST